MLFPNWPVDSLKKFFLYGGLLLFFSALLYCDKGIDAADKEKNELKVMETNLKYSIESDSILYKGYKSKYKEFIKKDSSAAYEVEQKMLLLDVKINQKNAELMAISNHHNDYIREYNRYVEIYDVAFEISFFLVIAGLIMWAYDEMRFKKTLFCQSCGMKLENDIKPHTNEELCSTCFDGKNYSEPNLTLAELKQRVQARMQEQGINSSTIKRNLGKMERLKRWSKELKWK